MKSHWGILFIHFLQAAPNKAADQLLLVCNFRSNCGKLRPSYHQKWVKVLHWVVAPHDHMLWLVKGKFWDTKPYHHCANPVPFKFSQIMSKTCSNNINLEFWFTKNSHSTYCNCFEMSMRLWRCRKKIWQHFSFPLGWCTWMKVCPSGTSNGIALDGCFALKISYCMLQIVWDFIFYGDDRERVGFMNLQLQSFMSKVVGKLLDYCCMCWRPSSTLVAMLSWTVGIMCWKLSLALVLAHSCSRNTHPGVLQGQRCWCNWCNLWNVWM